MNDLVKTVHVWQKAADLACASSSSPGAQARRDIDGRMRAREGKIRRGAVSFAGWSGAAYVDQSPEGRRRVGFVIGLMSSTLNGLRRISRRASLFARQWVKKSVGGGVFEFSEMIDHVSLPGKSYALPCGCTAWHAWSGRLRKSPRQPGEEGGRRGGVSGPSFPGDSTDAGRVGIGQCVLDSGIGEPSGRIPKSQK